MATTFAEVVTLEPATVNVGVPVSEAAQQMRATSSQTEAEFGASVRFAASRIGHTHRENPKSHRRHDEPVHP
jgi:hypothetical protein